MKRGELMEVIQTVHCAIQDVIENWEHGDLAAAVNRLLQVDADEIVPCLEWWESDE